MLRIVDWFIGKRQIVPYPDKGLYLLLSKNLVLKRMPKKCLVFNSLKKEEFAN